MFHVIRQTPLNERFLFSSVLVKRHSLFDNSLEPSMNLQWLYLYYQCTTRKNKSDDNNKMNSKALINALAFKSLKVLEKIIGHESTITFDCPFSR